MNDILNQYLFVIEVPINRIDIFIRGNFQNPIFVKLDCVDIYDQYRKYINSR